MTVAAALKQLLVHHGFRRLLAVRVVTQGSDGILQLALASYVLFSPQQQPNAAAIAAVLAITLLPFSVIGPFVSMVLDRWDRRRIVVVTDSCRVVLALSIGALVLTGARSAPVQGGIMALALVALSANRFLLAALSAALPYTIDEDEYLSANTIMPIIGPAGVMVGAAVAAGVRLVLGQVWQTYQADAVVFTIAAVGFATSATLASRFAPGQLGPSHPTVHTFSETWGALVEGARHLVSRPPAALGIATIGLQRVTFGVAMVGTILMYRNRFHELADVDAALADLAMWGIATGAGFVLASVVNPAMVRRLRVRRWIVVLLVMCAISQAMPGSVFTKPTLVAASFLLGLWSQSLKMCVDTLVQAHVDDAFKGRVFIIYDAVFNTALVLAAVIAAFILPADGASVPVFLGLAGVYLLVAALFALRSRRLGVAEFDLGTESITQG